MCVCVNCVLMCASCVRVYALLFAVATRFSTSGRCSWELDLLSYFSSSFMFATLFAALMPIRTHTITLTEPKEVPVTISNSENGCKEDINFRFTGFRLSGRVLSECMQTKGADAQGNLTVRAHGVCANDMTHLISFI